jgi:hypothetical protein
VQNQGLKRKRDGNPGTETQGSNLPSVPHQTVTSTSSSVVQYPTTATSSGVVPSAPAQLNPPGSQSVKLVFSHNAKEASTPSSQSRLSQALQPQSAKAKVPTQTTRPKAMRDRTTMPVYNLVKLSDNSRRINSHTSVADQHDASSSSSTDTPDVDISRNISDRPRLLTTKTFHEIVRLSDSSSEEDSETGGASDETDGENLDPERNPQSAQVTSFGLTAENERPYNIWRRGCPKSLPCRCMIICANIDIS